MTDPDFRVAVHRIANQRRAAGKPSWAHKIDIKHVLHRDQSNTSPEYVTAVAREIGGILQKGLSDLLDDSTDRYDGSLDDMVTALTSFEEEDDEALDQFNYILSDLYDWADINRVWLGH